MDASTYMPSGIFAKELEDELMKFTASYEDCKVNTRLGKQSGEVQSNANVEVNITDCTKSGGREFVAAEYHDTTESSSSFGNSDTNSVDPLDDSEIISEFHGDAASSLGFEGLGEPFRMRKKRVTGHWRSFIQPLMWRCKWAELQIRTFESQARRYDRELEEHNRRKKNQLQNPSLEGLGVKSLHLTSSNPGNGVYMRKKRKRTEDTMDIASYMSRHNLFSYHESKKSSGKGLLKDDELKNRAAATQKVDVDNELWVNDEQLFLEPGDGDNPLETILGKIEFLRTRVLKMKSRVEKVMSENAGKLSFMDDSSILVPFSALIGSHQNTSPNNGDKMPGGNNIASQLKMEHKMGDVHVPENGMTSNEVTHGGKGSTNHVSFTDAYRKQEEEILIDNKRVKEEMNSFEEVKIELIRSPLLLKEELASTNPQVQTAANPPTNNNRTPLTRTVSKVTAPKTQRKSRKRRGVGQRR
ncbi:hypothetical protein F511_19047 [Dorcoceras hygrometricum]|uniref:Uncharacterized protein n=1 Tax=Dorcoceras hygrometricum TaxID=472368 RepID=A0A2Z7CG57_9LAMI|nr:hypothetical protein F511_19047 [Dorcoceras hygrometricum]